MSIISQIKKKTINLWWINIAQNIGCRLWPLKEKMVLLSFFLAPQDFHPCSCSIYPLLVGSAGHRALSGVALGQWALKEALCQKLFIQLLLHCDLCILQRPGLSQDFISFLVNPDSPDSIPIQCSCSRTPISSLVFWFLACWSWMNICHYQGFGFPLTVVLIHVNWQPDFGPWVWSEDNSACAQHDLGLIF